MTFSEWVAVVDGKLTLAFGRTHEQVEEWPWYEEYSRGSTAEDAAYRMIEDTALDYELAPCGVAR